MAEGVTMECDALVIGAGLAGLSAAATIACACDAAVIVLEAREVGSNNPTPMVFTDAVERFELADCVTAHYRRFTFHSPLGNLSSHTYDKSPLVALNYARACRELLRRAQEMGNVSLVSGHAMDVRRSRTGAWTVSLEDGREIVAPVLIDGSGKGLFAVRKLGLPGPRMFSHCKGQVFAGVGEVDREEVRFLASADRYGDGGGWFYPLAGGRASFGYAVLSRAREFPGEMMRELYERALHEFEPYAGWLAQAEVDHTEVGTIPFCPPRRFVYDGLMMVGDAAGQATTWSCMGCEQALVSGQLAGNAAVEAHRRGDYSRGVLNSYQRQWDRAYRRIYRQGAWLAPVSWRQSEESWNRQVPLVQQLTPDQMLMRLRTNWPQLPWWKIAFIRAYDLAGRVRRGLVARLKRFPG